MKRRAERSKDYQTEEIKSCLIIMLEHGYVVALVVFMFVIQVTVTSYRFYLFQSLKKRTFPTLVGFAAIVTSTLFTAVAGVLVFFTKDGNSLACEATILTCIFLYAATKSLLYLFFIERMHIVHKTPSQTRLTSPLYILNLFLIVPYAAIVTLMVLYRIAEVGSDDMCRIGLRHESSIPLLAYDTVFSVYSIIVFVWPLFRSQVLAGSERLMNVAKKNIIGSVVSTISSFSNIYWLYYHESHTADGCLLFCTIDVMVSVVVMNYLISGGKKNSTPEDSSKDSSHGVSTLSRKNKVLPSIDSVPQSMSRNMITDPSLTRTTLSGVNVQTDEEAPLDRIEGSYT